MYTEDNRSRTMTASYKCSMGIVGVMLTHSDTELCIRMPRTNTMRYLAINIIVFENY